VNRHEFDVLEGLKVLCGFHLFQAITSRVRDSVVTHSWQPELCDLLGFHHRLQDLTMGISITKPNLETGI
jgi:hypothetical protein